MRSADEVSIRAAGRSLITPLASLWVCCGLMLLLVACGGGTESELAKPTPSLHFDLVKLFMNARAYDAASPVAQKLYRDHPKDPRPPYYLGVILREREAFENAERYLLESIKRDPTFAPAHDALGILYGVQNRLSDALIAHRRATELAPRDAQFWHNLGFVLTLSKRYDQSIKAYQTALALAPEQKKIYHSLGLVYAVKGDDVSARRMLLQATTPAQAWLTLATLQERRGDLSLAQESFSKALELDPSLTRAERALTRIHDTLRAQDQALHPSAPSPIQRQQRPVIDTPDRK